MKKLLRHNSSVPLNSLATKRMHVGKVSGKDYYADYYVIENVSHMIRDSVMNEIFYNAAAFDALASELMTSNARIPSPMSHPSDENGGFVDANDPITFAGHNIGAFDTDWRVNGDKLVSNTYIPVDAVNSPKEQFAATALRIKNKQPIDRSTGLYLDLKSESGCGPDGEPYEYNVTQIFELNHSAILDPDIEPGAKNNSEAVGMFTNAKGEQSEITDVDMTVNANSPAMKLPIAPDEHKWDESAALNRVREYTSSADAPTSNYRKFFLAFDMSNADKFEAYHLPFVDIIDGKPYAVKGALMNAKARLDQTEIPEDDRTRALGAIEQYEIRFSKQNNGIVKKAINWLKSIFVNELSNDEIHDKLYNKLNEGIDDYDERKWPIEVWPTRFVYRDNSGKLYEQAYHADGSEIVFDGWAIEVEREVTYKPKSSGESNIMDKAEIIALLAERGISVNANATDAELKAALNTALASKKPEGDVAANADLTKQFGEMINNALKPLQDQLAANASKELEGVVAQVVALNKGIDETAAKAMGLEACKSFLAANGQSAFNIAGGVHTNQSDKGCAGLALLDME